MQSDGRIKALGKTELIAEVANQVDLPKTKVADVITMTLQSIQEELAKKGSVSLPGFGTFKTSERTARKGKNPNIG